MAGQKIARTVSSTIRIIKPQTNSFTARLGSGFCWVVKATSYIDTHFPTKSFKSLSTDGTLQENFAVGVALGQVSAPENSLCVTASEPFSGASKRRK